MDRHIVRQLISLSGALLLVLSLNGCGSTATIKAPDAPSITTSSVDTSSVETQPVSTMSKMMQAIGLKKSPPPPAPNVTVQQVPMQIFTGSNLNAGNGKKPLALVVKFYQLRSADRFQQLPFDDFVDDTKAETKLGNEVINSREMLVLPRQHYANIETMPIEARYLGVVALFRSPAAQRWRFVYDVKKSMLTGITLGLHACAMSSTSGKLITDLPESAASLVGVHCISSGS